MRQNYLSNHTGDIGETLLMAELVLRGVSISIPFGHNNLYDLVAEHLKSGKLLRVQIKNRSLAGVNCVRIFNIDKYIGKIDVLAILVVDNWHFLSSNNLKKFSGKSNFNVDELGKKNNFKIFGVDA